jgi:hypothetical protein
MATLLIKSEQHGDRVIKLKLGANRFGRSAQNDFQIDHHTISATHCEVEAAHGELRVRDCGSTNGTFIEGEPIQEATLYAGQCLRLGEVELIAENTQVAIEIPRFDFAIAAPPVVLASGSIGCARHPEAATTHRCKHCSEFLCDTCVRRIGRRGGRMLKLCPKCSQQCEAIGGEKKKKKSLLGFLRTTLQPARN